jgi:hypothetical protein
LAGVLGLFMSLCGGGFFLAFTYSDVKALFVPMSPVSLVSTLPFIALAAAFAVGGAFLFWKCIKFVRNKMAAHAGDDKRNNG